MPEVDLESYIKTSATENDQSVSTHTVRMLQNLWLLAFVVGADGLCRVYLGGAVFGGTAT